MDKSFLTKSDLQTCHLTTPQSMKEPFTTLLQTRKLSASTGVLMSPTGAGFESAFFLSYSIGASRYIEVKKARFFFSSAGLLTKFLGEDARTLDDTALFVYKGSASDTEAGDAMPTLLEFVSEWNVTEGMVNDLKKVFTGDVYEEDDDDDDHDEDERGNGDVDDDD